MFFSSRLRSPVRTGLIALFQLACLALAAEVPQTLPFQGRVSIDGVPFTGTGQFKFALLNASDSVVWNSAADSSPADGEPDTPVTLAVSKGLYSVLLGQGMDPLSATLFSTHGDLRLRVWFNDGTHGFQRLNPDQPIGSVAYALRSQSAANADVAQLAQSVADGGILESKLANDAVSNLKLASDPGSLAKVSAGVVESIAGNLRVNPGALYGVNPHESFQYDSKSMGHYALGWMYDSWYFGGPTLWMSGYGGLKFFARGSLAMSIDPNGRVIVENRSPETTLSLKNNTADGRWWAFISAGTDAFGGVPPGSFSIADVTASAARMLISPSGQVGINTTTPAATLDVRGDLRVTPNTSASGVTLVGNGIPAAFYLRDSTKERGALALAAGNGHYSSDSSPGDLILRTGGTDSKLLIQNGAGSAAVLIKNNQVGIGVANPDAPLSIRRDSANSSFGYCLALAGRDGTPWWKLGADNGHVFSIGAAGLRDYDISIIKDSGNVGIGAIGYSNAKLRVAGDLWVNGAGHADDGFWLSSDSRLKTQVGRIEDALARVDALRGVSFHWRQDNSEHPRPKGRQIGFIAQDVAAVLPELVHTNADGYLSVNYDGVAPVLVEAVHEMKQQFDARLAEKNAEIQGLQTRLSKLESTLASLLTRDDRPDQ